MKVMWYENRQSRGGTWWEDKLNIIYMLKYNNLLFNSRKELKDYVERTNAYYELKLNLTYNGNSI